MGCGTGSLLQALAAEFPDCRRFGLDPSADYLLFARSADSLSVPVAGDVEALPFVDRAFDHCLSLLVLEDLRDRARALSEMRRVTRRGGIVAACQWDFAHGMPMIAAVHRAVQAVAPQLYEIARSKAERPFASLAELRRHWLRPGLRKSRLHAFRSV